MDVLVYAGQGTSGTALSHTLQTLRSFLSKKYTVRTVEAASLADGAWEGSAALVVIPGGRDLPYCDSLQPKATDRIRRFVEEGGKFLGICAGAYFASAFVEFEVGRQHYEVRGPRQLKFFPGIARGCVYLGYKYASEEGARAANLEVNGVKLRAYHNGGCYFDLNSICSPSPSPSHTLSPSSSASPSQLPHSSPNPSPPFHSPTPSISGACQSQPLVTVLGWYDEDAATAPMLHGDRQPAVVSARVGKGVAVLTGAHFEYFSDSMYWTDPVSGKTERHPLAPILAETDEERNSAVRWILGEVLRLECPRSRCISKRCLCTFCCPF